MRNTTWVAASAVAAAAAALSGGAAAASTPDWLTVASVDDEHRSMLPAVCETGETGPLTDTACESLFSADVEDEAETYGRELPESPAGQGMPSLVNCAQRGWVPYIWESDPAKFLHMCQEYRRIAAENGREYGLGEHCGAVRAITIGAMRSREAAAARVGRTPVRPFDAGIAGRIFRRGPRKCHFSRSLAGVALAHLAHLLEDLLEVVARGELERREVDVGHEFLLPQELADGQEVPVIDVRRAR